MKPQRLLLLTAIAMATMAATAATASADRTITYKAGPFHMGGFQTKLPKIPVRAPQMDGYVTWMNATLHDASGRRISIRRVMLHHIVFLNDGRPDDVPGGSCKGRYGEPFYGTGEEREQLLLPKGYGYPVHHDDRWRMQTMLMSHSLRSMNVYVHYSFKFTKRKLTPVKPFWIRANGCTSEQPSYTVDARSDGSISRRSFRWKVPVSGHIVAAGGHLHGGAEGMSLTQPGCDDRKLLDTDPLYAPKSDLVYRLRPILHEPGPVGTRYFMSKTGIPVRRGSSIDLHGDYDGRYPRARVMSIMHVYIAPGPAPSGTLCTPLPEDRREVLLRHDGHLRDSPYVRIPFNQIGNGGRIRELADLPGDPFAFDGSSAARVRLVDNVFKPAKIQIPQGTPVTWLFKDRARHNVLFMSGPQVVGSPTLARGASYTSNRFTKPGTYQLFCYLHPVTMHQEVIVTPAAGGTTPAQARAAAAQSDAAGSELPEHPYFGW